MKTIIISLGLMVASGCAWAQQDPSQSWQAQAQSTQSQGCSGWGCQPSSSDRP